MSNSCGTCETNRRSPCQWMRDDGCCLCQGKDARDLCDDCVVQMLAEGFTPLTEDELDAIDIDRRRKIANKYKKLGLLSTIEARLLSKEYR